MCVSGVCVCVRVCLLCVCNSVFGVFVVCVWCVCKSVSGVCVCKGVFGVCLCV